MITKIVIFIAMQILATLLFKWGSDVKEHWMAGFISGNIIGVSSIWFLMGVYKQMNPNIAMGICMGSSFLLSQLALLLIFRTHVNFWQWAGIALITCGVVLVCLTADTAAGRKPATALDINSVR